MPVKNYKKILLAPLDWGMGHTTRTLPIIDCLQNNGHSVVFAGNAAQCSFVAKSVGDIEFLDLEGYNITYGKHAAISTLLQVRAILKAIKHEHNWLLDLCNKQAFDGIISDNRYGLYHPNIPSIFVTHQLRIRTKMGTQIDSFIQRLHYRFISHFTECWVPDIHGNNSLAGVLSNPDTLPHETKYLGPLSQFENVAPQIPKQIGRSGHMLVLLSGPEPQRSVLSKKIWQQIKLMQRKEHIVFVEGTDNYEKQDGLLPCIKQYGRVTKELLLQLIQSAELIICRSGYSTLMDLLALDKKAVIIPTPGQPEQEYLGMLMHKKGIFYSVKQWQFQLDTVRKNVQHFPFETGHYRDSFKQHEVILNEWVNSL